MPSLNFKKVDTSAGTFNSGDILFVNNDKSIYVVESDGSKTRYTGPDQLFKTLAGQQLTGNGDIVFEATYNMNPSLDGLDL